MMDGVEIVVIVYFLIGVIGTPIFVLWVTN